MQRFTISFEIEQQSEDTETDSPYAHVARSVLEAAYAELQEVKNVLYDAGAETIPADRGVKDLRQVLFARDEKIAELYADLNKIAHERTDHKQANEAARAELIEFGKRAYAKLQRLDPQGKRDELQARYRGILDVLAKYLVTTGEAGTDEGHAVARRLIGVPEGKGI